MKTIFFSILLLITTAIIAQPVVYPKSFTVALDGTGDFKTIQQAIYAVRDLSQQTVTIYIGNGIYREKLVIPSWKTNIVLQGKHRDSTIITYDDYAGKKLPVRDEMLKQDSIRTYTSFTLRVEGNNCQVRDLTVRNTAGRVGQAVALHVEGDCFVAHNCNLLGNQDTYYAAKDNSRQLISECYIEGTTDLIFGEATVYFKNCIIRNLTNSFITAASTRPGQRFGYVFNQCKLIADTNVTKAYLGRPWRPYAQVVFLNTEMGAHIIKEGWENWRNTDNEKTVLYAEYRSTGPGASPEERVKWSRQLSKREAKKYSIEKVLGGDWFDTFHAKEDK